jgi:predicted nucleic acid-binding protein
VQQKIKEGKFDLIWSYILDLENLENPFPERKDVIAKWKSLAVVDIEESDSVLVLAKAFASEGLHPKDALHVACAMEADCKYFLTTDDRILKKMSAKSEIKVVTPIAFIEEIENYDTDN